MLRWLSCLCFALAAEGAPLFLREGDLRSLAGQVPDGFQSLLGPDVEKTALRELLSTLRVGTPRTDCSSCAVVGGAGTLIKDEAGSEIDEHECVFRINNAPTKTYQHYVGRKRTFQILGMPSTPGLLGELRLLQKVQKSLIEFAAMAGNLSMLVVLDAAGAEQVLGFAQRGELPRDRARVIHPLQMKELCKEYTSCSKNRPSTGLIAVYMAQQICASPPTVFGFDANSVPFHYYDLPNEHVCDAIRGDRFRGQGAVHQWETEQQRLERWHNAGRIRLYRPSGSFSPLPDTSMCGKANVEIQVQTVLKELRGNYFAQAYVVNGKPVYERPPTATHPFNIMLHYALCRLPSGATGAWVFVPHEILADVLKQTPGIAVGCNAMALSEDFRPEAPHEGTWKVATGRGGELRESDFVLKGLEVEESSLQEYLESRRKQ